MSRARRLGPWVAGVGLLALCAIALFAPAPPQDETLILRRFLTEMHLSVSAGAPVDGSAFLLLHDVRTSEQERPLLVWADAGGTLIVADPSSEITRQLADPGGREGIADTVELPADCVHPAVRGVGGVTVAPSDGSLVSTSGAAVPCFADGARAYALFVPRGSGTIVLLGGGSVMSNELLREGDNAVFTLGLVGDNAGVVLGTPTDPNASSGGIWAAIPTGAKAAIFQLALAVAVFAIARGRRFGRPRDEPLSSPIPSGELVYAAGALYRSARAYRYCARLLRRITGARLARRLGVTIAPGDPELPVLLARAAGVDGDRVRRVLDGPDPAGDEELIALTRELDALTRRLEGADR